MIKTKIIGMELRSLTNLIRKKIGDLSCMKHEDPLTMMHGRIIAFLRMNKDGDVFQRDLEQEFEIARPTATKILQSMEKNELITRQGVDYDARLKKILLTDKAMIIFESHDKAMIAFEETLVKNLSEDEINNFLCVIEKMKNNLGS